MGAVGAVGAVGALGAVGAVGSPPGVTCGGIPFVIFGISIEEETAKELDIS